MWVNAGITTSGGNFNSTGSDFDNTNGVIATGGGDLTLTHTGDISINANMTVDDASISGDTIAFGNATLSANDVTLTALGAVTGGTATNDISISGGGASLSISGASVERARI